MVLVLIYVNDIIITENQPQRYELHNSKSNDTLMVFGKQIIKYDGVLLANLYEY